MHRRPSSPVKQRRAGGGRAAVELSRLLAPASCRGPQYGDPRILTFPSPFPWIRGWPPGPQLATMRIASHRIAKCSSPVAFGGTMTGAALALPDRDEGLTPLGYALPPNGPVPRLTKRIVELLRVGSGDLVIDLCCDGPSSLAVLEDVRRRSQIVAVRPFGERLARLLTTSGVRTVQMDALGFGQFPMRYEKVLVRG